MTKFLVERRFHVGEGEMQNVGRRSRQVIVEQFPEITWHHSHVVVDDEGTVKSYCVYEAPNEEIVRRHGDQLGSHDIEGVYEIAGDVTPEDFPLN
jgi:Fe2+ or Zn2+ uptake regulation protein